MLEARARLRAALPLLAFVVLLVVSSAAGEA